MDTKSEIFIWLSATFTLISMTTIGAFFGVLLGGYDSSKLPYQNVPFLVGGGLGLMLGWVFFCLIFELSERRGWL